MKQERMIKDGWKTIGLFKYFMTMMIAVMVLVAMKSPEAASATTVGSSSLTAHVFYDTEVIDIDGVVPGARVFMSTDGGRTWEDIEHGYSPDVDISTLLKPKAVDIYFKTNLDSTKVKVTLMAEPADLKASCQIASGAGIISYNCSTAGVLVEYKKGTNGTWRSLGNTSGSFNTALYEIKGATLYFRTAATPTRRAGKIIAVKVPKRPSAPSVKLDGSKLCITGMKSGSTQYRVGTSGWITFYSTTDKTVSLYTLLVTGGGESNAPIPAGTIEIRTMSTDKKGTSACKVIDVPLQQDITAVPISLNGTTLTITDSSKLAYEYCRIESNATFNLATAKWSPVASNKNVIIPKASVTDKIYVRRKSYTDSVTKQVVPASTYKLFPVTTITTTIK